MRVQSIYFVVFLAFSSVFSTNCQENNSTIPAENAEKKRLEAMEAEVPLNTADAFSSSMPPPVKITPIQSSSTSDKTEKDVVIISKKPLKKIQKENKSSESENRTTIQAPKTTAIDENKTAAKPMIKEQVDAPIIEVVQQKKQPNHANWDALLRKYVSNTGSVDYSALKTNKASLQAYLDDLSENTPQSDWSRNEAMAYWINAYNAFTIKLIVDNYPVKSITDLDGGKPWDKKWIKLGTKTYSLNQIENDILRPKYKDARIHFAVNCAAKSCPPLLNRAFLPNTLNAQLEKQTKNFIKNAKFTSISADKASVSKIFEWYAVDFGDLITYLNTYSTTKLSDSAVISYMEYDWGLNK